MRSQFWLVLMAVLLPVTALAQAGTTTTSTVVSLETLIRDGQGAYEAFKVVGIMGGISAAINLLINVTKFGPVAAFIKRKGWKWLRPVLAILAGLAAGAVAGLAEGLGGMTLVLYVAGGALTGGGAIALHELVAVLKGERK